MGNGVASTALGQLLLGRLVSLADKSEFNCSNCPDKDGCMRFVEGGRCGLVEPERWRSAR